MPDKLEEAKRKARETYDSAADFFDHEAIEFWARYGAETVERLDLAKGANVLDVGAGSGASAIPAARIVGSGGKVTAVDLSSNLLNLAKNKAENLSLNNIEFIQGDMTNLGYPDNTFDAVVCVFAIFFVPDMEKQVGELWRMVKPGGKLAITTWGHEFFEPAYANWKNIIKQTRADLHSEFNPWDRISEPNTLRQLMIDGGATNIEVTSEEGYQLVRSPQDWWTIAMGSGLRWAIDQLTPDELAQIRDENISWINDNNVGSVITNVLYAVASKD